MWKYRDELKNNLSKAEMQELLQANNQKVPKGESAVSGWGEGRGRGRAKACGFRIKMKILSRA